MNSMQEDIEETKNYEITFFVSEENASPVLALLKKYEARVTEEKPFQKIAFAYPVEKQTQCFMGIVRFAADSQTAPGMIRDLKLEKNILRFMIQRAQNKKELNTATQRKETVFVSPSEDKANVSGEKRGPRRFFEKILTNEALEKKIEEMLQ